MTPLCAAAKEGHSQVVSLLLTEGAMISMSKSGGTFFDLALQQHHKHVVLAAIQHDRWIEILCAPTKAYPSEIFGLIEEMPELCSVSIPKF